MRRLQAYRLASTLAAIAGVGYATGVRAEEGSPAPLHGGAAASPKTFALNEIAVDYNEPDPKRGWDNYVRAFFGGLFINYVIWQVDWFRGETFHVTRESIGSNLKTGFVWDDNQFKTNFFGHPYHGSMYYGAARGAGLSYWESLPFPWVNSFIWEFMGERHYAAPNDWIMTSYGGAVIGEALFRLANEVLDMSDTGTTRGWNETGTMAVSPLYGFQRLASGRMTEPGPKPKRTKLRLDLNAGIDRFRTSDVADPEAWDPTVLFAVDVEYGDLLPKQGRSHLEAFEFFDLYAAAQIGKNSEVSGGQLFVQGIAYAHNSFISSADDRHPDNNVFGIVQSFDFQSANVAEFGGAGLGLANYTKWRFSSRSSLRLQADVQGSVLSGATSPFTGDTGRSYNFSVGGTLGLGARWDTGSYGQLGVRGKQYYQRVVNGEDGTDFIGYVRGWYEVPLAANMGIGAGTTFVNRKADYDLSAYGTAPSACAGDDPAHCEFSATGLSWQLYLLVVNQ
jgi:hypothetical protein